jgi:3-oxoacyl-[acyl-carrier-protein] synthase-1
MIAAKRLLDQNICDAVISGGADTLCKLTLNGFTALEAVSAARCDPFSARRNGINIGEGAGVFLLSKTPDLSGKSTTEKSTTEKGVVRFCGGGISMDAHHMSAPDPEGRGAVRAMQAALTEAGIAATDISYVNLHGTATRQNDAMESHAMTQVFPAGVACSSTKPLTGHALGAASAIEATLCLLALNGANDEGKLPPHIWSGEIDSSLPPLAFTQVGQPVSASKSRYMMSNSFAFGGNNVSLIFGQPL